MDRNEKDERATCNSAEEFRCTNCGSVYSTMRDLQDHWKNHSNRHICGICSQEFSIMAAFQRHKEAHMRPHVCSTCGKRFYSMRHLIYHRSVDGPRMSLSCQDGHIGEMQRKENIERGIYESTDTFHCENCGKVYLTMESLRQHWDDHANRHICGICYQEFRLGRELLSHKIVHERPYECDICGSRFSREHFLLQHKSNHF